MKLAICLLTRDKVDLVRQSLPVLLDGAKANKFHLFVIDGSITEANEKAIWDLSWPTGHMIANVRGGADTAVLYALNFMLDHVEEYTHVGLVESDVVLDGDWFDDTCLLYQRAHADQLEVGNVSARSYEDRVLFQRDGYAVMHNLGFGTQILTREAATIFTRNIRSGYTTENRRVFMQLAGLDIGRYWAFRTGEHWLVPDWGCERILAQHGLASVALTPARCKMIGQTPPLAEQGLTLTTGPVKDRLENDRFVRYRDNLSRVRKGDLQLTAPLARFVQNGTYTIFAHHLNGMGAFWEGEWGLEWAAGFGPFAWKSRAKDAMLTVPAYGSINFVVGGTGRIEVEDTISGYKVSPFIDAKSANPIVQVMVPGNVTSRMVRLRALNDGVIVYAMTATEPQPVWPGVHFHHSMLPPV